MGSLPSTPLPPPGERMGIGEEDGDHGDSIRVGAEINIDIVRSGPK